MINKTVWQVESKIVVKMEVLGCSSAAADGLAKVLILYVGGTIGMTEDEHGSLRPCPGYLTEFLENMPEMKEKDMPNVTVKEYGNLVDSSDMDASDWTDIVTDIENEYYNYDGFVVLQGTDTLAYSGSALSFMLENLGKPVILTGSMIPLSKGYSDARRNLLISVNIAGNSCIPEVCIFFHDRLIRGNRCKKMTTNRLDAFHSPNMPNLATVGVSIQYHENLHRAPPKKPFRAHKSMDLGVIALRLIPGFDDHVFNLLAKEDSLKAIVIEMYGTGNAPSKKQSLVDSLKLILDSGKVVVIVSQCPVGHVDLHAYAVGRVLANAGCLSAIDMTLEAVATKLAYLFGKGLNKDQVQAAMVTDLRGELTQTLPGGTGTVKDKLKFLAKL